jgi:multimeric flavodoxin WrbA
MTGVILDGEVTGQEKLEKTRILLTHQLEGAGYQLELFRLREMEIAPCQGCFGCWVRNPGACLIEDDSQSVVQAIVRSELLVLLTPLTFGGYSSELKKGLDRGICLVSPFFSTVKGETHHKPRYDQLPKLLGVGVTSAKDLECEQIFEELVHRNAVNFHSPCVATAVIDTAQSDAEIRLELAHAIGGLEKVQ